MRNLLALVGLAVIGFGGVGWYMGWYKLSVGRTLDGNLQINTVVDTQKAGTDSSDFLKNVSTVIGSHVDKAAQEAKTAVPPTAPGGMPGPFAPSQSGLPSLPTSEVPTVPTVPTFPVPGPIKLHPPK